LNLLRRASDAWREFAGVGAATHASIIAHYTFFAGSAARPASVLAYLLFYIIVASGFLNRHLLESRGAAEPTKDLKII
jgi:hypothetical protein